ncbi:hypothetical protein FRC08_002747 [Ceratobasidium sp. 394]|nr:hypothetical protein FRC08_002747 [Ceratobasidium sp. 394]KAG9100387.1 hypothetical protein FS749_015470 [Ceratobasidium sp. UAMH 11750]
MLPSPPSEKEAMFYYAGLPSGPPLVARTGIEWEEPTGPEAYRVIRELRAVGNHALKKVWEDNLALKVHALLDSSEVKWTSTDIVRIRDVGEDFAPVILWIGVMPGSLSGNDGVVVASKCRELLEENGITDVDVEIRESVVTRLAGPKLLTSTGYFSDPTAELRDPLTTTLGIPICAQSTPWVDGSGGFFITEGENTKRLLLVTARHVVFSPDKNKNNHFEHKDDSQPRHNVTLFGDVAFNKYLDSILDEIGGQAIVTELQERCIKAVEGMDDLEANEERRAAQKELRQATEAMEKLNVFYQGVSTHWATRESRLLGHVILSPPISVGLGSECYTEDWAIIEIDTSKVDASNFQGNAIDLGTRIPLSQFTRMMCPDPRNLQSFKYPRGRLLRLKDTIPDEETRHPTTLDQNGDPHLVVIKRGHATGLTVGHANDIYSYARNYYDDGNAETSKEWAILPFDSESGAFSEEGDSGSAIVDSLGRIGGLLASGAGAKSPPDITYATPISFLLRCMEAKGLHSPNLNPVLTA